MSLDTSVRRSVDDFDTRFDQNVIPHHEILGDNIRWSGVHRPNVKPKPTPQNLRVATDDSKKGRLITQGFTPLPLVETPFSRGSASVEHKEDKHKREEGGYDASEAPTTPPEGVNSILIEEPSLMSLGDLSFLRKVSTEDQELFKEVIDVISETQIKVTSLENSKALKRMRFSELSELETQKLATEADHSPKSTFIDKKPWLGDE